MNKILLAILLISATSCAENIKSSLGLKKTVPNEFTVISYPPLTVPPQFQLEEFNKHQQPINLKNKKVEYTIEEKKILQNIDQPIYNSDVKKLIEAEQKAEKTKLEQQGMIRNSFSLFSIEEEPIIDANAENTRIINNRKYNKPINHGITSIKQPSSLISKLFN